jgi:hypothetical protein
MITVSGAPHHLMLQGHNPLTTPQPITIVSLEHGGAAMVVHRIQAGAATIEGHRFDLAPGTTDLVLYFSGSLPPAADRYLFTLTATAGTTPIVADAEIHRARREPLRR